MFTIRELMHKTHMLKSSILQCYPIMCKKRHKSTDEKDPKRLVNHCLLIGYSGSKYSGMQFQTTKGIVTVEGILFQAMLENNWIEQASYKKPKSIKYQEASRTDKGVSAARQCCSILLPAGLDAAEVNDKLPDDVRLFGLKRVTDKFNARRYCTARTYTYTVPSIAFCHFNDQVSQRDYRISSEKLKLVNELLQIYAGNKNFHNFTINKTYLEKSSVRHIKQLECGPPFIHDGVEFCVIRMRGNSFMMHQIRKMMGLLLAVVLEVIDASIFDLAFTESPINCPTAPGLGLVLDRLHFDEYNRACERDGLYENLTWEECHENVEQFHDKFIQSNILHSEIHNEHMLEWLENLLNYPYHPVTDDGDGFPKSHIGFV